VKDQATKEMEWPYPLRWGKEATVETDVLILGGGVAGCWAAIAAAKKGLGVALVEKGATIRSGAGGSGCDHWESAATNPNSRITPEELTQAKIRENFGYNNGISHYIECREGYDRLLDLEKMGGKVRDTEDEFVGAEFRDEDTKLLYAYDYVNRFTLRVWGTTFKPALFKELKRLGVDIFDRTMATCLLTEVGLWALSPSMDTQGNFGFLRPKRPYSACPAPHESGCSLQDCPDCRSSDPHNARVMDMPWAGKRESSLR
jgi:hypothetical protein